MFIIYNSIIYIIFKAKIEIFKLLICVVINNNFNLWNIIYFRHIKKHLDLPTLDTSKMSEQELQFHYFKMHDADNNNKLDGCELIKSLIHWHGN